MHMRRHHCAADAICPVHALLALQTSNAAPFLLHSAPVRVFAHGITCIQVLLEHARLHSSVLVVVLHHVCRPFIQLNEHTT